MIASRPVLLVAALVLLCFSATLVRAGFWGCPNGKHMIGHCIPYTILHIGLNVSFDDWIGGGYDDANCNKVCSVTLGRYYTAGCCSAGEDKECWCY